MPSELTARPRLRPGLSASRDARSTEHIYLYDTWRQSPQPLRLTLAEFRLVEQMNGQLAVSQLLETSLALSASGGEAMLHSLLSRLENGLYLDGPGWQARLAASVREPSCLGTYAPDASELRKQLLTLFNDRQSSGLARSACETQWPTPSRAGATHRLWSRRAYLYLGVQGIDRTDDGFPVCHHWHFALQPTSIHADAQALQNSLGHRAHRWGLHRSPGKTLWARLIRRRIPGSFARTFHRAGSRALAISDGEAPAHSHRAAGGWLIQRCRGQSRSAIRARISNA